MCESWILSVRKRSVSCRFAGFQQVPRRVETSSNLWQAKENKTVFQKSIQSDNRSTSWLSLLQKKDLQHLVLCVKSWKVSHWTRNKSPYFLIFSPLQSGNFWDIKTQLVHDWSSPDGSVVTRFYQCISSSLRYDSHPRAAPTERPLRQLYQPAPPTPNLPATSHTSCTLTTITDTRTVTLGRVV